MGGDGEATDGGLCDATFHISSFERDSRGAGFTRSSRAEVLKVSRQTGFTPQLRTITAKYN